MNKKNHKAETPQIDPDAISNIGINIKGQFIKDLSFENPKGPDAFDTTVAPDISVDLRVDVQENDDNEESFEVALKVHASATSKGKPLFILEIEYCGNFNITNAPPELMSPLLFIECPRLLFPFVRSVIASITTDSGFPPLVLAPVDFQALYAKQITSQAKAQKN